MDKDPEFEQFWSAYPRKVAKAHALKMWRRLTDEEKFAAIHSLPVHLKFWRAAGTEGHYIPHPGSWIGGHRWEDELEMPKGREEEWWKTQTGIEKKAKEVGCWPARHNEGWHELKARILAKEAA